MTRCGFAPIALLALAGSFVVALAFSTPSHAQGFGPRNTARAVRAPSGGVGMTGANAPRAGSVDRRGPTPAYQQAAVNNASPNEEYFDPLDDRRQSGRSRTTVNRAAYQEMGLANNAVSEGEVVTPIVVPEDLPVPSPLDSMPAMGTAPYGPLRYRGESARYSAASQHTADCGCDGGACDGSCGPSGGCGDCGMCDSCPDWYPGKDLTLFAGVHGFKNSVDGGQNGNFGFQEGVNWSSPFWNAAGVGFQLGFQAMQSDFHDSAFFSNDRSQFFITTGLFRRQMCEYGWQWGVVYDHLSDEFVEDFDVSQIRGELSYLFRGHELGVWFASASSDDQPGPESTSGVTTFETVDQYAFFYRRRLAHGGEGRLWAGFTGESDTIFGGDLRAPLACDWDVVAAFNYLSPQDDVSADGSFAEAWNLGINLVWYVCPEGAFKAGGSRYRPLLNVADNGSLIVNTVR